MTGKRTKFLLQNGSLSQEMIAVLLLRVLFLNYFYKLFCLGESVKFAHIKQF